MKDKKVVVSKYSFFIMIRVVTELLLASLYFCVEEGAFFYFVQNFEVFLIGTCLCDLTLSCLSAISTIELNQSPSFLSIYKLSM